jgi:hypothetical protein
MLFGPGVIDEAKAKSIKARIRSGVIAQSPSSRGCGSYDGHFPKRKGGDP